RNQRLYSPQPGRPRNFARLGSLGGFLPCYLLQAGNVPAQQEVRMWTKELTDDAISVGGIYYLPYQIMATKDQFYAAYPRAKEFFELKHRVDPSNKFRNRLWDTYDELSPD